MWNHNRGEVTIAEYQGLDRFQQNNSLAFNGGYNPDGAQN